MPAKTRRTLTVVGMGVVASAALSLSATAASAATPTSTSLPVQSSHTTDSHPHSGNQHDDQHGGGRQQGHDDHHGRDDHNSRDDHHGRDDRHSRARTFTVDRYNSRHACESAARAGIRNGHWDTATCNRADHGHKYELVATVYQGRHRTA